MYIIKTIHSIQINDLSAAVQAQGTMLEKAANRPHYALTV
jgi:hypothetical protein